MQLRRKRYLGYAAPIRVLVKKLANIEHVEDLDADG
jgi:hypothetical protein